MMNSLSRSILNLYTYDAKADDTSILNVLRQCLNLISQFPMLMVYGYHTECTAGAMICLSMRRPRNCQQQRISYDAQRPKVTVPGGKDPGHGPLCFTWIMAAEITPRLPPCCHLIRTDTYSTIAAAMASLKGPKHGGANNKVTQMFKDKGRKTFRSKTRMKLGKYLNDLLRKKHLTRRGLIYGMGHAIYSVII